MALHEGTILVVDDESESLRLLTGLLSEEGYQVRPADSGKLALAAVAAQLPDLILLDIRMPGMDGFEVCRRLKASPETSSIPLMFISAIAEVQERVEGLSLGAVDFVAKPFRRQELLARVRTHLELSRLRFNLELQVAARTAELKAANRELQTQIDERVRAEQSARESAARFQTMADTVPVGIWMTDRDGVAVFCNKSALAFIGLSAEALSESGWSDLVHPDDLDRARTGYTGAVAARRSFRILCRIRRSDRRYRWILNVGSARYVDRVFVGHLGTSTDITDLRRRHERALAAQELKGLRVLAAGVAHDFNVLLGAIAGQTDVALSDLPTGAPARDSVEKVLAVAMRGSELVRLLIAYAGGQSDVGLESVHLSSLVADMLRLLRVSLPKNLTFRASLAEQLPAIPANAMQIREVVLILIMNAAEALKGRKGSITVSTTLVDLGVGADAQLWPSLPPGRYVRLTVADWIDGAEVLENGESPGPALGLAPIHGILREHGGAMRSLKTPGAGSTFEVMLPCNAR